MLRPLLALLPLAFAAFPALTSTPAVEGPALSSVQAAAVVQPVLTQAAVPADDVDRWSDRRLAASLVLAGYDMGRTDDAVPWVREGLGGVVLFGTPPADLAARLARLRAAGPVVPMVASDEEGGLVQRLKTVLGPLPSAEEMGRTRTPAQVQELARSYGAGMARLGVDTALSPVADLAVAGRYIAQTRRAFSTDPAAVGAWASAWSAGMRASRVAPVVKHWPGHGSATNTHDSLASTPPLSTLEARDLRPFADVLRAGAPAVMVGHLKVPGLTEPGLPATLSPAAYRYLRGHGAGDRLVMTDSLSMGAIRVDLGLSPAQAAVRALRAGADVVLLDPGPGPGAVVDAVAAALRSGEYPRASAVASARRLLAVKRTTTLPLPATTDPARGSRRLGAAPTLTAAVADRVGGRLTAQFFVRNRGAARWDVLEAVPVDAASGTTAALPLGGRLRPGGAYEWTARTCNAAGLCSTSAPLRAFTTRPA